MPEQDSQLESHYPLRQPPRKGRHAHDDLTESEEGVPHRPGAIADLEREQPFQLPPHRGRKALFIGVIAGVLCSIESIMIAFANRASYHQASSYTSASNIPLSVAYALAGAACLTFFVGLLICVAAGFIVGKVSVQRRYGFLAGFVAGIITYGASFLLNYIPNYPGKLTGSIATNNAGLVFGGIAVVLIIFLIWGLIVGLVSLFGAWLATRKHAYYVG